MGGISVVPARVRVVSSISAAGGTVQDFAGCTKALSVGTRCDAVSDTAGGGGGGGTVNQTPNLRPNLGRACFASRKQSKMTVPHGAGAGGAGGGYIRTGMTILGLGLGLATG